MMTFKFDRLLEDSIGFGRYQMLLCVMVAWFGIPSATNVIGPVFLNYKLGHRCLIKDLDNTSAHNNLTESMIRKLAIPFDNASHQYSKCSRFQYYNSTHTVSDPKLPCVDGYKYDRSVFTETTVSEFDLVCDRAVFNSLSTSLYMLGILLSAFVFSNLCDRYGRKPTMVATSIGSLAIVITESLAHSAIIFCICRFLLGFFSAGVTMSTFVYVMEITPTKWRARVGLGSQMFFAMGYVAMSGISYIWRHWRHSLRFTAVLYAPFMIFLFFIPESPRWLFTSGNSEKGKQVTLTIIRKNGNDVQENIFDENEHLNVQGDQTSSTEVRVDDSAEVDSKRKYTTIDLFKSRGMLLVTLSIMFIWFVDSFVFYGISLNAGSLDGDIFINHALNGVMQLGGYAFCVLVMDKIGRRLLLTSMLLISGAGLMVSTLISLLSAEDSTWKVIGLIAAFTGKFGISGAYAVTYNITSELYPTVVRSIGFGMGSMTARIGGILAPFVIGLQDHATWIPNVSFTFFAWLAAGISLSLPETNQEGMTETIPEAEEFYRKSRIHRRLNMSNKSSMKEEG